MQIPLRYFSLFITAVFSCFFLEQSVAEGKNLLKKLKITEEKKENDGRLLIAAKRMMKEGEGQRDWSKISGEVSLHQTTCPVCEIKFQAYYVTRQLPEKGMDSDFCKHANYESAYDLNVWCCPKCGYANFSNFFENASVDFLDKAFKEKILAQFRSVFRSQLEVLIEKMDYYLDQRDIPTNIKYKQMKMIVHHLDLPWKIKANFYLQYAWTERMRFVAPIVSSRMSLAKSNMNRKLKWFEKMQKVERVVFKPWEALDFVAKVQKETTETNEKMLLNLFEAAQWDRLGFPNQSFALLKKTMQLNVHKKAKDLVRFKKEVLMHEISLLKEASICIREALKGKEYSSIENLHQFTYLLAELYRRLHLMIESKAWFEHVQKESKSVAPNIFLMVNRQIELLPKGLDASDAEETELILISAVEHHIQDLVKKQKQSPNFQNLKYEENKIETWLIILDKVVSHYYKEFEFDPNGIKELVALGLLKNYPELEKIANQYFSLEINKKDQRMLGRYRIVSLLPYEDKEGRYWPLISEHKLSKERF